MSFLKFAYLEPDLNYAYLRNQQDHFIKNMLNTEKWGFSYICALNSSVHMSPDNILLPILHTTLSLKWGVGLYSNSRLASLDYTPPQPRGCSEITQ